MQEKISNHTMVTEEIFGRKGLRLTTGTGLKITEKLYNKHFSNIN